MIRIFVRFVLNHHLKFYSEKIDILFLSQYQIYQFLWFYRNLRLKRRFQTDKVF